MILPYRIGLYALLLSAAFMSGFFYSQMAGRQDTFKEAVAAFQNRERINHDISKLGDVDLCITLGGLPDECSELLSGLDETAESESSGKNDQR